MAAIHPAAGSSSSGSSLPPLDFSGKSFQPARYQICGRFVHPNGEPLRMKFVKVKAGILSSQLEFFTDQEGRFVHDAKTFKPFMGSKQSLVYKVYEANVFYDPNSTLCKPRVKVAEVKQKVNIKSNGSNVGDIAAAVYEYQADLPDLQQPKEAKLRPQQWPYTFNLITAAYDEVLRNLYATIDHFNNVEEVQHAFRAKESHLKVSPETTIEMMLNGIFAAHYIKGPGNNLFVRINWDQYDKEDRPQLPDVEMTLTYDGKALEIIDVVAKLQNGSLKNFNKEDPDFLQGLYLFNCAALLRGEIESHLTKCHFWTGQAAMAVFRSLSEGNPIKTILAPHLKGVLEINRMGADAIFGPKGVLNHSGLTVDGIMQMVKHNLGAMCYKTFTPRKPLTENHRSARCGQLFWEIINKVVRQFVEENKAHILNYWNEIYAMSHNLVAHSPKYRPYDGVENYNEWFDQEEIDNPDVPGRVVYEGELKAVRPITLNPLAPNEGDLENLIQFICVCIQLSVEEHDVRHRSQSDWMTNLDFGSIAPNNDGKDPCGGTTIEDAQAQLTLARVLTDFKSDALVENKFGDVYEPLIRELLEHRVEFEQYGMDVTKLSYGIVI